MDPSSTNLYPSRRTPTTREQPPHMPALPRPRTRSSGPVGTTTIPPRPTSRREGRSPHHLSLPASSPTVDNMQSRSMGPPPIEESAGSTPTTRPGWRNEAQRLLRASPPFQPILEEPPHASFAPTAVSTPFSPWERWPGNEHPPAPPPEEASRAFMAPLSHLMHPRSAVLCTPPRSEAPVSFSAPYPTIQPAVTIHPFVHSPHPHPIAGVHPIALTVDDLSRREEEYFCRFSHTPRPAQPLFIPPWPQSGPAPPRSISPRLPTPTALSESSVSSSRTPLVGPHPFLYSVLVGAPPSVGQPYLPV